MQKNVTSGKLWNRNYILCMAISAIVMAAYSMFHPALSIYGETLGYGTDIIGGIVGIATFICMFGRMLVGGWSDRYSRKKIVMISLAFLLVGYLLFFFSSSIAVLLVAKIFQAVSQGMITTVLNTVALDTLPPDKMGAGIGYYSLASSLAQCFAPQIGTNLSHAGLFPLLFGSSAVLTVAAMAVLMLIDIPKPVSAERVAGLKRRLSWRDYICVPALPAACMLLFNGVTHASVSNYLSICGLSRGIEAVGIFFTINSIAMIITRPLCGKLADRKPLIWTMLPGYALMIIAFLLIASAGNIINIVVAAVLYGTGFGATQASIQLWALRRAGPESRGIANSTFYVGGDLGLSMGAYFAGSISAFAGYTPMYLLMGCVSLCSITFFVLFNAFELRKKKSLRS